MRKLPTRALFWDIDGTLLVTGRAGMMAWEQAFAETAEGRAFPAVRPDGLTDHQIAAWLLGIAAHDQPHQSPEQDAAAALVARYERALPAALTLRQGRVLDNVVPLLESVRRRSALRSWLVTGNTQPGGAAKLRHYGLSDFFREPGGDPSRLAGSFSVRVEPRARIVGRALQMAQAQLPGLQPAEVLVIGDTPHDIESAHASGVPVLAVASNVHGEDELAAHGPWRTVARLPEVGVFEEWLAARE
jgi:phosphoglycolate phosphatase-like HAD superfamily hydrolase